MKIFASALHLVATAISGNKSVTAQSLVCIDGQTPCPNGANSECAAEGCDSSYTCVDNICRQVPSSAPSPAALSYTYVGNGACGDGNNEVFSAIRIRFPDYSQERCNALCISSFYHPSLVGFGEFSAGGEEGCFCYYTGGTVPSIKPPMISVTYEHIIRDGNGPVMGTSTGFSNVNCYAYAKGTGSPTTPGATQPPITPSPTGTATSAPTPRGITSWINIGNGTCTDVNQNMYNFIEIGNSGYATGSVAECAQACQKFPSPHLVGFTFEPFPINGDCDCLYSGDDLPTPPSGSSVYVSTELSGTGPIRGVDFYASEGCYAFTQGTASPTTTPTVVPTSSPTTTAPTKSPVTLSPSANPISPAPSTTAPTKAPITSSPTAKPISPTPSPQSAPTKAPITSSPTAKPISPTPPPQSKSSKETKTTKSSKNSKVV